MTYEPKNEECRVCDYPPPHLIRNSESDPGRMEVICVACRTLLDLPLVDSEDDSEWDARI